MDDRVTTTSSNVDNAGRSSAQSPEIAGEFADADPEKPVSRQEFGNLKVEVNEKVDDILKHVQRLSVTLEEPDKDERDRSQSSFDGRDRSQSSFGTSSRTVSYATGSKNVRWKEEYDDSPDNEGDPGKKHTVKSALRPSRGVSYGTESAFSQESRYSMGSADDVYNIYDDEGKRRPRTISECTWYGQVGISRELSTPVRCLGIALGFTTVVFLWEATDMILIRAFPRSEVLLVSYLGIMMTAAVILVFSGQWIQRRIDAGPDASTLTPSFVFALSTLFLAIGSWGAIGSAVAIVIAEKKLLFFWSVGGLIALISVFGYAYHTRHNVLLDIASCVISLDLVQYPEDSVTASRYISSHI